MEFVEQLCRLIIPIYIIHTFQRLIYVSDERITRDLRFIVSGHPFSNAR